MNALEASDVVDVMAKDDKCHCGGLHPDCRKADTLIKAKSQKIIVPEADLADHFQDQSLKEL